MATDKHNKNLYNIGVSYKKADATIRGKFSISKENQVALLEDAKQSGIDGIFVLSTCNRTEITGFAAHPFQLISLLCKYSNGAIEEFAEVSNVYKNNEAIRHLFRMGTGLDSQILGDYEIVGQLRQAFKLAKEIGTVNAYFERLLNHVMQASKRVKNETKLSSGTTSVSYAAVQYLIKNLPSYNAKNMLVFGLGKMGKHTCKNLAEYTQNKSVRLVNRTEEKAIEFVKEHPAIQNAKFENLNKEIANTDVLIVSTGAAQATIKREHVLTKNPLLILDLSMPANVSKEVADLPNVTLINVDELSKITDETLAIRQQEVPAAEKIIEIYKNEFKEWLNHRKFTPAITALKESLKTIQQDEIAFHKKKIKDFDESQAEVITSRFIQKITTQFVKHLKTEETSVSNSIEVMAKVFGANLETIHAEDN
ncbi:glutamyl-tRNA reductase [Tenacibaculum finnmarkense genomovar finnmarkense]|uniref:Glutamyl-tRNA reductase n=1 Tax=Tenacibaculum finnmarkense genomovar finnmarkense TaxID=1458503 RepID=A0AAP1RF76_9FLAO|nr:glutamyl-tRNA reductase [Tenacibaculum finnmarkense]MBE7633953.1 glutamyl-tRNA reductase [Tenacibaculum finnmarkense genomovar ulcerans]MBE7645552.1 glutamyl-tRNA reductase [Tenacibaculum finnmarkense genomovar ulcerans]MBE7647621.1 glutamyl-tRNA reductase [Tenacibaculum finnmarkense genomovar ulcerans]MBE7652869.1 glutamyl-tRNA reductase [Tenacibaculum finnmarkense genomovar finnmarkense]MBE7687600.1 glutamyl-tRNA reductase [Tenacibaculum finnmarkense genomovar ulcerans]